MLTLVSLTHIHIHVGVFETEMLQLVWMCMETLKLGRLEAAQY